jgi:hypothetical protein
MRIFFILLVFLFSFSSYGFAQDTIMKNNGEMVQAKIIEISPTEIKYKKFNFIDGPTYIENKSGIKYVIFSNGLKEQFSVQETLPQPQAPINLDYYDPKALKESHVNKMEPWGAKYKYAGRKIGENEMQKILMKTQDRDIVPLIQTARDAHKLQFLGFAAIPLGIASVYLLGSSVSGTGLNSGALAGSAICLAGAIACPIVSGIYKHKRTTSNRKAVEIYNQKY